jgi:hypothetical protein
MVGMCSQLTIVDLATPPELPLKQDFSMTHERYTTTLHLLLQDTGPKGLKGILFWWDRVWGQPSFLPLQDNWQLKVKRSPASRFDLSICLIAGIHPRALILIAPFSSIASLLLEYKLFFVVPLLSPLEAFPAVQRECEPQSISMAAYGQNGSYPPLKQSLIPQRPLL